MKWISLDLGARAGFDTRAVLIGAAVLAVVLFAAVAAFDLLTAHRYASLLLSLGISVVLAVGYQIFCGNTGIVSFGHPAFVAIGAYAAGIVSMPPALKTASLPNLPAFLATVELGLFPSLLVAGGAAALLALAIGPVVLRLAGTAAGIMTFGLLVIVNEVLRNAEAFTRGNQTFFGVPRLVDFPTIYAIAGLVIVLAVAFKFSRFGLRARMVRDDALAAETAGTSIVMARLAPWVLSAFVMGVGGGLMAFMLTAFSPRSFYVTLVIPMMIMAVLGGLGSVVGAVCGALLITAWEQFMRLAEGGALGLSLPVGSGQLTLGLALILILYLRPGGLFGSSDLGLGPRKPPSGAGTNRSS